MRLETEETPCKVSFVEGNDVDDLKNFIKEEFPSLKKVNKSQISILYKGNVCEVDDSVSSVNEGNTKKDPLVVRVPQGILSQTRSFYSIHLDLDSIYVRCFDRC